MGNLFNQKVLTANNVFDSYFLNTKTLYLYCFSSLPSLAYNNNLDGEKAFKAFAVQFCNNIEHVYEYRWYKDKKNPYRFDTTVVMLKNNCLVEFDKTSCEILHDGNHPEFVKDITALVNQFKARERKQPLEINLVIQTKNGLELKAMEIKRTKLDISLFYDDDFIKTDEIIRLRLKKKDDKGIILLHGLPGSGKTSYLRYLVGRIKKKVMFLSPSVAGNLMDPDFIELLISNPNTVLIIEDAENIIMDRKHSSSSAVSNLLNISDGLLADFLNVQLICTFNSSLTTVDSALIRKGRLIARHEFGKLSVVKSQRLSNHLGFDTIVTQPMTIAEISNQHEQEYQIIRKEILGFRSHIINN
jgi:hypothetical protein